MRTDGQAAEPVDTLRRAVQEAVAEHSIRFVELPGLNEGLRGWFVPKRRLVKAAPRRDTDLEVMVFDSMPLLPHRRLGRVVFFNALYLPEPARRRGIGTEVAAAVAAFAQRADAAQVQAAVGTPSGSAALKAWGFDVELRIAGGLPAAWTDVERS